MVEFEYTEKNSAYNSPMEFGLRSLFIMSAAPEIHYDLQRLIYLDYLAVHSDDVEGGPTGLHAKIPYRSAEILVKRALIEQGLMTLVGKELVIVIFNATGVNYQISELGLQFISLFQSDYALQLIQICGWLNEQFSMRSTAELEQFINRHMTLWGGENPREAIYRKGILKEDEFLHF